MNNLMVWIGMAMIIIPIVAALVLLVFALLYVSVLLSIESYRNRNIAELFVLSIGWMIAVGTALLIIGDML